MGGNANFMCAGLFLQAVFMMFNNNLDKKN